MRDREGWAKRQSSFGCSPRFIVSSEKRKAGGKPEVRVRIISIDLDSATAQLNRFLVFAKEEVGVRPLWPSMNAHIYRAD